MIKIEKINDDALRVGKEIGKLEADIDSTLWVKQLVSLVNGEENLKDHQVRVISLRVLKGISSRLNEPHVYDFGLDLAKTSISNVISGLERWKIQAN